MYNINFNISNKVVGEYGFTIHKLLKVKMSTEE